MRRFVLVGVVAVCLWMGRGEWVRGGEGKFNVLFIAVDDLRPTLGCYGSKVVKSPNIDRLAAGGMIFDRAYCQQAVCSPSRTSLLTGCRPDTTRVYDLETHFRDRIADVVTLPQWFKQNGYFTQGLGKIYHGGLDDAESWSVPHWPDRAPNRGKARAAVDEDDVWPMMLAADGKGAKKASRGPAFEASAKGDDELQDGQTCLRAIAALKANKDRRFFLAVGFLKPHLPFIAPKKYWDLYDEKALKLAENPQPPKGCPGVALMNFEELRTYRGIPKGREPIGDELARKLVHGYYAATSYTDALIGRVLDELKSLGLEKETIVILWGDHGWQLGEHGLWCKHTNFEVATRSMLMIRVPGQANAGARCNALVEFVDVYPTLCELAGLAVPPGREGTSFVPLVSEPGRAWKKAAFSQYPRPGGIMGYSMRTDRWRYTEWRGRDGQAVASELYDHQADPDENVNCVNDKAQEQTVAVLAKELKEGWRGARP